LQAGRAYEAEKRTLDPDLLARVQPLGDDFILKFSPVMDGLSIGVVEEYQTSQWLVDNDVIEVYKALGLTLKTLDSGIHYESLPEGSVRLSLYRRLKEILDEFMRPQGDGSRTLRVSEALQVMDFLVFAATVNSNPRPKSRQYLDWLTGVAAERLALEQQSNPTGRLIGP
jgi:hypothetical protein